MCLLLGLWTPQGKGSLLIHLTWYTVGVNKLSEMNGWVDGWMNKQMKISLGMLCGAVGSQPSLRGGESCRADHTVICAATPFLSSHPCCVPFCHWAQVHIECLPSVRLCKALGTVIKEHCETGTGSGLRCFVHPGPSHSAQTFPLSGLPWTLTYNMSSSHFSFLTPPFWLPHSIYWNLKLP